MLDRILTEPWSFWGGILIWVPLSIWIVTLVGWMVTGEADIITGMAGIGLAIGLGYLTMKPPDKSLPPFILSGVFLTTLFYPLARTLSLRRALGSIDAEVVEKAYQMLRERPASVGSEVKIASVIFDRGLPGHSIAILERLVGNMPPGVFGKELASMVSNWRARTPANRLRQTVMCSSCGTSNEPGPVFCVRCGGPFLLGYLRGSIIGGKAGAKLLSVWLITLAVSVLMAWSAMRLPPGIALGSILGLGLIAAVGVWLVFRPREGRA